MGIVLDASIALAWMIDDELTSEALAIRQQVIDAGGIVAAHWPLEVANALLAAERRGRLAAPDRIDALRGLEAMPIKVDEATGRQAWHATFRLAEQHRLTIYDAAYLELAQRTGLPLATLDGELRTAAERSGVEVLPA